jgi:GTP-binding protein HflX
LDLLPPDQREVVVNQAARNQSLIPVSAVTGEGIDDLLQALDARLAAEREVMDVTLPSSDGAAIAWLYEHGDVIERDDADGATHIKVSLDPADRARFAHRVSPAR